MGLDDSVNQDNSANQDDGSITRLKEYYKKYQSKLLQVSQRNRSVSLKKIYNKHNFDLTDLDEFKENTTGKITEKAFADKKSSVNILADSASSKADGARGRLGVLYRNLRLIEEETGQQTGFLGFPFLQGHVDEEFFIRGPVILFPINLEQKRQARGGWYLNLADNKPRLNGALLGAIKKKTNLDFQKDYEELFDELIEDIIINDDIDQVFFQKINEYVKKIIPNIDESKNVPALEPLKPLTKKEITKLGKQELHLVNHKIIGNFPQADDQIFRDYDQLAELDDLLNAGVINELFDVDDPDMEYEGGDKPREKSLDDYSEVEFNSVIESDSSQDQIIIASKSEKEKLIVVRGPPGTGKSQTIVNLVADGLTNGKKILVVCQKAVALQVVLAKLAGVGLNQYVVLLDKEHEDRRKMYSQLSEIMTKPSDFPAKGIDINSISSSIDEKVAWLSKLGNALRKKYYEGISIQELYTKAKIDYNPVLDLKKLRLDVTWNNFNNYFDKIQNIQDSFKKFENPDYPWFGQRIFSEASNADKNRLEQSIINCLKKIDESILVESPESQKKLVNAFDTFLNNPGFLKRNRNSASKIISEYLQIKKPSEEYVSSNYPRVKMGIEYWNEFSTVLSAFTELQCKEITKLTSNAVELKSKLTAMIESLSDFDVIQQYSKDKQDYPDSIFNLLLECYKKMKLEDDWNENIKQEIYHYWIDHIEEKNTILKGKPFTAYEKYKKELTELIKQKKKLVCNKIKDDIESRTEARKFLAGKRQRTRRDEVWRDLYGELNRKRKVKPVRKLFQEYSKQLFQIAPCWLASPESVSKVFPLKRKLFDLVIVDEASQLPIEKALPFLYRADHVIIAGDEKQLQPFDLFQIKEYEDEDEFEDIPDEKSLLDFAKVRHHPRQLNWHYRSKYQELINFSNHAFYDGKLEVAPNVIKHPKNPHVNYILCNGMWENNTNHVECKEVIDQIKKLWSNVTKYPSILVITFNDTQKELIELELKKQEGDPEFAQLQTAANEGKPLSEHLRVKNIENVQGDERDVVIFSIGYAENAEGKFANRFGTLNQAGGENRLNVAITRAREKMIVISSIKPEMIKTTGSVGPKRLQQFLEYAKASSESNEDRVDDVLTRLNDGVKVQDGGKGENNAKLDFDSDFEVQVHTKLVEKKYEVHTQVGHSGYRIDLAIVHPKDHSKYILAVECDGATFHSAKSVKERDVMRQEFLERAGWKFARIWSRNWWKDSNGEIAKIVNKVDEILKSEN